MFNGVPWVQIKPAGYQALAQRHRAGVEPA
jgi:hypothetical protein